MAKNFDPSIVSKALARGSAEARTEPVRATVPPAEAKTARKRLDKTYLSVTITKELHDALYEYNLAYRKTNPQKAGLHPGIGGATERLLRDALGLPPL